MATALNPEVAQAVSDLAGLFEKWHSSYDMTGQEVADLFAKAIKVMASGVVELN